jgi:hypothetical protein
MKKNSVSLKSLKTISAYYLISASLLLVAISMGILDVSLNTLPVSPLLFRCLIAAAALWSIAFFIMWRIKRLILTGR